FQIHQHQIRLQLADQFNRLSTVISHTGDFNARREAQNNAQPLGDNHLIIYDQHPDHRPSSTVKRMVVPVAGALTISSWPLHNSARSRMPTKPDRKSVV